MAYQVEVTDTFGGESNYSWVRRTTLADDDSATRRKLVRKAKAFAGYTGLRCDVCDMGDLIEIRPRGICQVCFVSWIDE